MTANATWQARRGRILLNRFALSQPLGQGGMGEVWRAHDRELGLDIALKLLHPELAAAPAQVAYLKNECRLARSLNHPHIVPVYDFHQEGRTVFISMAWVDGPSFERWIEEEKDRPWIDRLRPLLPAARALAYVHAKGLVHRDVKAGNILLDRSGRPYLTDFGIAGIHQIQPDPGRRFTGGSRHAMSPQQRRGLPPHPSDDIFSFGVLLLETLAPPPGGPLPEPEKRAGLLQQIRPVDPETPPGLMGLAATLLAEHRTDRPRDMAAVASALEQILALTDRRTIPPGGDPASGSEAGAGATARVIAPQPFAFQETRPERDTRRMGWRLPVFLGVLGILLLCGGGWLIHYLGRHPWVPATPPITAPQPIPASPAQPETRPSPPETAVDETAAEKALADWRQALADLEAIGAPRWAPEPFAAIADEAGAGDRAFLDADFAAAAGHYTAAAENARQLQASAPDALARLLAEGQAALGAGDGARSGERFELALKIDPQNPVARKGLERAAKVDEVAALMRNGEAHEAAGRLALALADYEAALALDPEWPPAQDAVPRVRQQVALDQFRRHMSAGLAALQRKDYTEARRNIDKALAFQPDAPEARDALMQIDAAARSDRIAHFQQQARAAEAEEAWDRALGHYRQALEIDPGIRFATQGVARVEERLRLEKRVAYYMAHPDDLGRDAYLAKAEELLAELRNLSPQGPHLQSRIATLDRMVQNARTPVVVTLKSDEQTVVTVYRVGRLGQFATRQLELRPGTYTIAGARDGYRDVRHTLRIRPGQGPTQVVVQCTEKI